MVDCKGGTKYEILVRSLNDNTQNLIDFEKSKNEIEKADWGQRVAGLLQASRNSFIAPNQANREPSLRKNQTIPTHAYQVALSRFDLVSLWNDYKHSSKNKTEAGKEFLSEYNKGSLYPVIFNVLGKVSSGTIYRWNKALVGTQDYTKLIPAYDYGEKESNPKLTKEEELVFKNFLLSPNKTNIGKATKLTKFILKKQGIESPTSDRNFRRYADNFKKYHYDQWILSREGQKALRDKVQPYIERDISKIEVDDILVADGHRLSINCINPFNGRPCRPTLIGYLDWKSTTLVGYEIMLEENTQAITSALRNAIINLGKYPLVCYQDNGKAFRAKFFTGDFNESGINGLFSKLGINVFLGVCLIDSKSRIISAHAAIPGVNFIAPLLNNILFFSAIT